MEAIYHAGRVRNKPEVKALLQTLGDPHLLDGYGEPPDWRRFRGTNALLCALVHAGQDTPQNLTLLFGDPALVEGDLAQLRFARSLYGPMPPLATGRRIRRCDLCHLSEQDPGVTIKTCKSCKRAMYCSVACQNESWAMHKPECLRARGRPVPQAVQEAADAVVKARLGAKQQQEEAENAQHVAAELASWRPDQQWTCCGKLKGSDLPASGLDSMVKPLAERLGMKLTDTGNPVFEPPGVPAGMAGNCRYVEFLHSPSSTTISLWYERLFCNGGDRQQSGLSVEGVFCRQDEAEPWRQVYVCKPDSPKPVDLEQCFRRCLPAV